LVSKQEDNILNLVLKQVYRKDAWQVLYIIV
jgi:hypothetical protein